MRPERPEPPPEPVLDVPRVSAATAERLWRQFTEDGRRHAQASAEHQREAIRCFRSALAFREQMALTPRTNHASRPTLTLQPARLADRTHAERQGR
ncbi:MAG: hypothetical protein ISP90_13495 [Nevskia sp.]|nr:hypothetical protein [Nevskia sp.]